jgi:hypothetical protein
MQSQQAGTVAPTAVSGSGIQRVLWILVAAQFLVFLVVISQTVMLTPFSGVVAWIDQYAAFKQHGGFVHYLFVPHNEHRMVTIRLLTAVDVDVLYSHGIAFIIAAIGAVVGIVALVVGELRRSGELGPGIPAAVALVLTIPTAMDWSVPANSLYPITLFFVFLSVTMLASRRGSSSIASGLVASLTNAAGIMVWFAALGFAAAARLRWPWFVMIVGAALVGVGALAFNIGQPSKIAAHSIIEGIRYWPQFVGLPWTRFPALQVPAEVTGVGLVAAALAFCARARTGDRLEAIAVAFVTFSIGVSILASIGRSGMGELFPPVRYAIFMMPLHLALLFFVVQRRRLSEPIAATILGVLLLQQLFAGYTAIHTARSLGVPVGL